MTVFLSNDPSLAQLQSPQQAAHLHTQSGKFAKQRHTFFVRFHVNGAPTTLHGPIGNMATFAVKSVDRPSVQPHVEELSAYNVKRQVYTGYKTQPIKISFYDTGDQSAQKLWAAYSKYYFGDFSRVEGDFSTGLSGQTSAAASLLSGGVGSLLDKAKGLLGSAAGSNGAASKQFGFITPPVTGNDTDSQYYLRTIEIVHVHNNTYDVYTLVHPKITSFDPDDLDYEQSGVAIINASFAYEGVLFAPGVGPASSLTELLGPGGFSTQAVNVPGIPAFPYAGTTSGDGLSGLLGSGNLAGLLSGLFGGGSTASVIANAFRGVGSPMGGGLGAYGNYVFGAAGGATSNQVTGAFDGAGMVLSASDISAVNAQANGSAQIGFNANIQSSGASVGFNGRTGVTDPSAQLAGIGGSGVSGSANPATVAQSQGQAQVNAQAAAAQSVTPSSPVAASLIGGAMSARANATLAGTYAEQGELQSGVLSEPATVGPTPTPPSSEDASQAAPLPAPPAASGQTDNTQPTPASTPPSDPGTFVFGGT